jgi:hypothetical protein
VHHRAQRRAIVNLGPLVKIDVELIEIGTGSEEFRNRNRPFDNESARLKTRLTAPREAP